LGKREAGLRVGFFFIYRVRPAVVRILTPPIAGLLESADGLNREMGGWIVTAGIKTTRKQ